MFVTWILFFPDLVAESITNAKWVIGEAGYFRASGVDLQQTICTSTCGEGSCRWNSESASVGARRKRTGHYGPDPLIYRWRNWRQRRRMTFSNYSSPRSGFESRSLTSSFNKLLLSTYYMYGTWPSTVYPKLKKVQKGSPLRMSV